MTRGRGAWRSERYYDECSPLTIRERSRSDNSLLARLSCLLSIELYAPLDGLLSNWVFYYKTGLLIKFIIDCSNFETWKKMLSTSKLPTFDQQFRCLPSILSKFGGWLNVYVYLQTLLAISRVGRSGRSRRKRNGAGAPEHSPLDLSAAGESAAKRARLSASPSTRSDSDDRDRVSNDGKWQHSGHKYQWILINKTYREWGSFDFRVSM